jgi:Ca2+-binding RTX toxin-like protein
MKKRHQPIRWLQSLTNKFISSQRRAALWQRVVRLEQLETRAMLFCDGAPSVISVSSSMTEGDPGFSLNASVFDCDGQVVKAIYSLDNTFGNTGDITVNSIDFVPDPVPSNAGRFLAPAQLNLADYNIPNNGPASFPIFVQVEDNEGHKTENSGTLTIVAAQPSILSYSVTGGDAPCTPVVVDVTATEISPRDTDHVTIAWTKITFDPDNNPIFTPLPNQDVPFSNITHTYHRERSDLQPAIYLYTITATDTDGDIDSLIDLIVVTSSGGGGQQTQTVATEEGEPIVIALPTGLSGAPVVSIDPVHGSAVPNLDSTLTYTPAAGLDGPVVDHFSYTVGGGCGGTTVDVTVQVSNAAPMAGIGSPTAGVPFQPLAYTLTAIDPSTADQNAGFTFDIDWGDGTGEQWTAPSGLGLVHAYSATGTYTIAATATDKDHGTSQTVGHVVTITNSLHQGGNLLVGGTNAADAITLGPGDVSGITGTVTIYAGGGDDNIQIAGSISTPVWIYGGPGDDRLKGGAGDDVLIGGEGDDLLVGGSGRDLIIGGEGADRIVGNADDDILVAGTLSVPNIDSALAAIMAEWTSSHSYSVRVASLQSANLLTDSTVRDDNAVDVLTGSAGQDWFLLNLDGDHNSVRDKAADLSANEFATDIDWINS